MLRATVRFMKRLFWKIVYLFYWAFLPFTIVICYLSRFVKKKYDIGLGPVPLINYVYLSNALKKKGYTTQTFCNESYFITDAFDFHMQKSAWGRLLLKLPAIFTFYRHIFTYKCIYTAFNGSLMKKIPLEALLYKIAGVRTVILPYGADCNVLERTPNKTFANALCVDYPDYYRTSQRAIKKNIDCWCRWADVVVALCDAPDYLPFWNKCIVNYITIDLEQIKPFYRFPGECVRIFHAPNHRTIKGTQFIIDAVNRLRNEQFQVELVMKEGVPNTEILAAMADADIVVDQLILGAYGMFAIEAMALGKPVICYFREDLRELYEVSGSIEPGELPLIQATPSTVYAVLKDLLLHKERFLEIGRSSAAYCLKHHSYQAIGSFFDEINKSIHFLAK